MEPGGTSATAGEELSVDRTWPGNTEATHWDNLFPNCLERPPHKLEAKWFYGETQVTQGPFPTPPSIVQEIGRKKSTLMEITGDDRTENLKGHAGPS